MASNLNLGELQSFIGPLFSRIEAETKPDASLPDIVVRNRLQRARQRLEEALRSRGSAQITPDMKNGLAALLQEWAKHSFEDAFKPIQDFEIQCARERDFVEAEESGDPKQVLKVLEKRYRAQVIEQFGPIELRGIQISHRVNLDLDEVYVPLQVRELAARTTKDEVLDLVDAVAGFPALEIWQRGQQVLLLGAPGSGKSTLVSYLATGIADGSLLDALEWHEPILPFVLVVRTLSNYLFTPGWFAACLGIDERLAAAAVQQQRVVLLVDGIDEAAPEMREKLLSGLAGFLKDNSTIRVLVTSRPSGGMGEIEKCFPAFKHFQLSDFTLEDVSAFIDKWCLAAEKSVRKDAAEAQKQAQDAAKDLKTRISYSRPVQRIAVNPLLTTILCVVHRFLGRSIPEHRVTLYEKCTDALLYEWDRAKFPDGAAIGALDAPQKRALLKGVARSLHERHAAEMTEQEVIQHFAKILPSLGKSESDAQRIVHEIRDRSGLLVERSPNRFGFSHLTFQEYLTALDYVASKAWTQLVENSLDVWWHEVVALAAGAPGTDAPAIIRGLLDKRSSPSTLLAAQCAETALDLPVPIRREVEATLEQMLPPSTWGAATELASVGMTAAPLLMKLLPSLRGPEKGMSLYALDHIDYEPAIPVIAQCIGDHSPSGMSLEVSKQDLYEMTNAEYAIFIVRRRADRSGIAHRSLVAALRDQSAGSGRLSVRFLRWIAHFYALSSDREITSALKSALRSAGREEKHSSSWPRSIV